MQDIFVQNIGGAVAVIESSAVMKHHDGPEDSQ